MEPITITLTASLEYTHLFKMMGKPLLAEYITDIRERMNKAARDYTECGMKLFQEQYRNLKEIETIALEVMGRGN